MLLQAHDEEKVRNANIDPRGPFYFITHGFLDGGHKIWVIYFIYYVIRKDSIFLLSLAYIRFVMETKPFLLC